MGWFAGGGPLGNGGGAFVGDFNTDGSFTPLDGLVGTMTGAFVGAKIAVSDGPARQGLFVTVLMLIAALMNLNAFPHPAWFWSGCIVVIVGSGYFGAQLGGQRAAK